MNERERRLCRQLDVDYWNRFKIDPAKDPNFWNISLEVDLNFVGRGRLYHVTFQLFEKRWAISVPS
jgi:hypothetical protein